MSDVAIGAGRVLVGFNGSPESERALAWAIGLADVRRSLDLRVLIATSSGGRKHSSLVPSARAAELAEVLRVRLSETSLEHWGIDLRPGNTTFVLLEEALHAALLVVGAKPHRRISTAVRESVSLTVAAEAPCPVAVVRPVADPRSHRVVVGVDGAVASERALAWAFDHASGTGCSVHGVFGWLPPPPDANQLLGRPTGSQHAQREEEEELLRGRVHRAGQDHPDVPFTCEVVRASPVRALHHASGTACLVVVGAHGRGHLSHHHFGDVAAGVLRHARCPVLVAR